MELGHVRVSDVGIAHSRLCVRGSPWICVIHDTRLGCERSRSIFTVSKHFARLISFFVNDIMLFGLVVQHVMSTFTRYISFATQHCMRMTTSSLNHKEHFS